MAQGKDAVSGRMAQKRQRQGSMTLLYATAITVVLVSNAAAAAAAAACSTWSTMMHPFHRDAFSAGACLSVTSILLVCGMTCNATLTRLHAVLGLCIMTGTSSYLTAAACLLMIPTAVPIS